MDDKRFVELACEFMAWDDGDWTGNALQVVREVLNGGDAPQVTPMLKGYYKSFIYGCERDEIVNEDFYDRFESDEEYQAFLDWAQSL